MSKKPVPEYAKFVVFDEDGDQSEGESESAAVAQALGTFSGLEDERGITVALYKLVRVMKYEPPKKTDGKFISA